MRGVHKLFVSNLPWSVGSVQLKKFVQQQFGKVLQVNVIFDTKTGLSQRYGFVTVPQDTLEKIELKSNYELEGSSIFFQSSK